MALREETLDVQNSAFAFDALFCEEESFEEDHGDNGVEREWANYDSAVKKPSSLPLILPDHDLFWEDDELVSLISKEKETNFRFSNLTKDGFLEAAHEEAVRWISKVSAHFGFFALTTVLAVNYFDRFIVSPRFQRDKPWMTQLTAVACLSLAAKMEETQVPFLLDLQVEESKYVFEAKTIQRMELLVLSILKWRMNPVTPISFFDHIVRRLGLKSHLHWELLWQCERFLLRLIADSRVVSYLPSTLAAATMIHVIREMEPCNAIEYRSQLLGLLKISEEQVDECHKLIFRLLGCHEDIQNLHLKRKRLIIPSSPHGVVDAYFSCDSSNDSWTVESVVTSSLEPSIKKSRGQDQQMHLPSLTRVSIDVLNSPR